MISAPAPLTAAPHTNFPCSRCCPQTTSSLSASEQSPTWAIHFPTLSVTVSFKTTFPTLQDPLSLGRSSCSLVSVTFTICPLSMLMPLFPMTNFAASTYARCTRNTRISNLRKLSRASIFWVQVPPLVRLKRSADDRLTLQCSFLGGTVKSSLSAREKFTWGVFSRWNCLPWHSDRLRNTL